jgi:predicted Fe-Mo cluster-binding NifX family protein
MSICLVLSVAETVVKIGFAVLKDKGLQSIVYNHFGSAPAFIIVDTEEGILTTVNNKATHHSQGACTPIEALIKAKIDAVVVGAIGVGAIMKLDLEGIKTYRSARVTVKDNLDLITAGSLRELTLDHACSGGRSGCSYH